MINRKYGVVYTPESLAEFTAQLIADAAKEHGKTIKTVLDPACGECALLSSAKVRFGENVEYWGIDVDADAVQNAQEGFCIIHNDSIMPQKVKRSTSEYWKSKLPPIDAIIANPPWSTEKIYDRTALSNAGFSLVNGQYDSYVLFLELSYNLLVPEGIMAFIIPDSLFDTQNAKLRQFLCEKTHICVIARLGEKIFDEVSRAATVIVCRKTSPNAESITRCFRLSTDARKEFLSGNKTLAFFYDSDSHDVLQSRFALNEQFLFDIDTRADEEELLSKIRSKSVSLSSVFIFGRGVEISKSGKIAICPKCRSAQGYKESQLQAGQKKCSACGNVFKFDANGIKNVISRESGKNCSEVFVGEDLHRYRLSNGNYIELGIKGIDYKNSNLYTPPKILIRKTGLGIYGAIDYSGSLATQTVYILKYASETNTVPLEYYLALINSRVVYYYYLKTYGENEWKSHPYLTKQILFDLPVMPYTGSKTDDKIVETAKELMGNYDHHLDVKLEDLIMKKYQLNSEEKKMIYHEMDLLPDLRAINDMKKEA